MDAVPGASAFSVSAERKASGLSLEVESPAEGLPAPPSRHAPCRLFTVDCRLAHASARLEDLGEEVADAGVGLVGEEVAGCTFGGDLASL